MSPIMNCTCGSKPVEIQRDGMHLVRCGCGRKTKNHSGNYTSPVKDWNWMTIQTIEAHQKQKEIGNGSRCTHLFTRKRPNR
jgi:hypothetical protein